MSQSFDTQGTIHSIGETTEHGVNGFTKREFIILLTGEGENPDYPNHMPCEVVKDKCSLLDAFQTGNEVKVTFNLGGNLWAGNGSGERAFATLKAWKIELVNVGAQAHHSAPSDIPGYAGTGSLQAPPGTGGAPQPKNYDDMIAEYNAADKAKCDVMWAGMDAAARAALQAALA